MLEQSTKYRQIIDIAEAIARKPCRYLVDNLSMPEASNPRSGELLCVSKV